MLSREDSAAWLTELLDGLGLERPVLVGSSLGGFHAACLAVSRPQRAGGLVLLAPAATLQPFSTITRTTIRIGGLVPLPFTVRPGLKAMMQGSLPDERIVEQAETGVAGFRYDRQNLFPVPLTDDALASIRCPTLVVVGAKEVIYDPARAVDRAQRLIPDSCPWP